MKPNPGSEVAPLVQRAPEFVFVNEQDQGSLRSHAMREHWKQRHHFREVKKRKPLSNTRQPSHVKSGSRRSKSTSEASQISRSPSASPTKRSISPPAREAINDAKVSASVILGDLLTALGSDVLLNAGGLHAQLLGDEIRAQLLGNGIRAQLLGGVNRALTCSQLDPFDSFPIQLTSEHHKLLHHWLCKYAAMMFEDLPSTRFNPMRDVWFPLDLSNASSFNAVMAQSAAHLAYVQGISDSEQPLKFKMEAVRIVTGWMNDPERALSDDAFAAVLRLLTYERCWGTEVEWNIHRCGLQRMVAARGGITALAGDWRLELAIFLVLLMSKPSWFDTTNQIWELLRTHTSKPQHPILGRAENCPKVRILWLISLIQDLRTFMVSPAVRLMRYLGIQSAMAILVHDFRQTEETVLKGDEPFTKHEFSRIACIFFICVLLQSVSQPPTPSPSSGKRNSQPSSAVENDGSLLIVDALLSESSSKYQMAGQDALYSTLFYGVYDLPDKTKKMEYVLNLTSVLGQMSSEARRGVSKCLLHILYANQANRDIAYRGENWTPDSLLSSIHGL